MVVAVAVVVESGLVVKASSGIGVGIFDVAYAVGVVRKVGIQHRHFAVRRVLVALDDRSGRVDQRRYVVVGVVQRVLDFVGVGEVAVGVAVPEARSQRVDVVWMPDVGLDHRAGLAPRTHLQ